MPTDNVVKMSRRRSSRTRKERTAIAATMGSFPPLERADRERLDKWVRKLRSARVRAVDSVVAFGKALIDAKAELYDHGQWLPALKLAGIEEREAQKYMRIARHTVLSNPTNFPHLPTALASLYLLSGHQGETVSALIAEKVVHPRVTTRELKEAVNGPGDATKWSMPAHITETASTFFGGDVSYSDNGSTKEWQRDDESIIVMFPGTHTNRFHVLLADRVAVFSLGKVGVPGRPVVILYKGERRDEFVGSFGDMGTPAIRWGG